MYIYINVCTAYCISSVISSFSNLNRRSSSLGLFCHVPLKRDQGDWHQRLWLKDTPNAIGCTYVCVCIYTRIRPAQAAVLGDIYCDFESPILCTYLNTHTRIYIYLYMCVYECIYAPIQPTHAAALGDNHCDLQSPLLCAHIDIHIYTYTYVFVCVYVCI